MLNNLIKDELIFTHQSFESTTALFEHIQAEGLAHGYVTDEFAKKLAEREAQFPTGLELNGTNVAIPHTDPEFIKEQFIAVYTLDKPVSFKRMDDPNTDTQVSVVFVLGLSEPHAQLEVLQALMGKLQDQSFINNIITIQDKSEIKTLF